MEDCLSKELAREESRDNLEARAEIPVPVPVLAPEPTAPVIIIEQAPVVLLPAPVTPKPVVKKHHRKLPPNCQNVTTLVCATEPKK